MPDTGRETLVKAIRNGDTLAFEIFFRAEYNNVVSFLYRYMHDEAMSQDIAQDAFIRLWESRERLKPDLNVRAYVFTIAKNLAINKMSLKAYKTTVEMESRKTKLFIEALSHSSVSERIDALELSTLISKVYNELPDKVVKSFIMSRRYGMTYNEIAEQSGISVKVVEYHIKLALQLFRKRLREYIACVLPFIWLFS